MSNLSVFFNDESESVHTKPCIDCGIEKPLIDFHYKLDHHDRHSNTCKLCTSEQKKIRYQLKKTMGTKPTECQCCGKSVLQESKNRKPRSLYLDHDHKTGKFRGWICHDCNSALARAGDNKEGVLKLLRYLEKNEQTI